MMNRTGDAPPTETTYSLSSEPPAPSERRASDRHLTLYRVGAMSVAGRRELCLIRNISEGGMMIRPYCDLAEGTPLLIELKSGHAVPCKVSWSRDGLAGVAFQTPIDVVEILSAGGEGPRPRMPRIEVDCLASVRDGSRTYRMRVQDVSQGGVKLETMVVVAPGTDLMVSLPGLSAQAATMRWNEDGFLGLTFNQLLPLTEFVEWLREMRDKLRAA